MNENEKELVAKIVDQLKEFAAVARARAVPLTDEWWAERMKGKGGVDWQSIGCIRRPVFETVMSDTDSDSNPRVLVGTGFVPLGRGKFGEVMIIGIGEETAFQVPGWGYDRDRAFIVTADGLLMKAGYDITEPSSGPRGLCWGAAARLNLISEKRSAANPKDDELLEMLSTLGKLLA